MRFIRWNHVTSSIDYVECQSIVLCYPALQTSSWVLDYSLRFDLRPSDSFNVLLTLNIRHLCVNITWINKNLNASSFETFKQVDSRQIFSVRLTNCVTARGPLQRTNIKLLLHILVIEICWNACLIWAAARLVIKYAIHLLVKSTIPESSGLLSLSSDSRIANTNSVVRIDSLSGLVGKFIS